MTIYEMTATFGKLDGQTLTLSQGLNVICAPNEWGKSTWCAFIVAMFYGIDTRARSGKDSLADKERYQPWSGKPMQGRIRLIHKGQDITIERSTKGKVPMGQFRAYDTGSGMTLPGLTGENCAQQLLGVEKSVFLRSGFIRLNEMPVNQDEALRRRLNALVTTADESGTAELLGGKLRELRNRCQYHRNGLIPEEKKRLEELQEQLEVRRRLQERLTQATEEEDSLMRERQELENHERWLAYRKTLEDREQTERVRRKYGGIRQRTEQLQEECTHYLSVQEIERNLSSMKEDPQEEKMPRVMPWGIAFILLGIAAGAALFLKQYWLAVCMGILWGAAGVCFMLQRKRRAMTLRRQQEQRENRILQREYLMQLNQWQELERCREELRQVKEYLLTLESVTGIATEPVQPDVLTLSKEQTEQKKLLLEERLRQTRLMRGQCYGRMENIPKEETILARIECSRTRLESLQQTYEALGYAQKALEQAEQELQQRFAPQITRRAQALFRQMTRGRYDKVTLAEDLSLTSAASDEIVQRSSLWRSDGTVDQMYLALRMAVAEALMPEGILVLDDALVRFDDERLADTMSVLKQAGLHRQIILFSCHAREKELENSI